MCNQKEKFFQILFEEDEVINLRLINNPSIKNLYVKNKSISEEIEKIMEENDKIFNIYFGIHPRLGESTKLVSTIRTLFVDIDSKDFTDLNEYETHIKKLLEMLDNMNLRPTIIVNSGHGKHLYWSLKSKSHLKPINDANGNQSCDKWKELQKALISFCKSDKSIIDLPRILRLPETYNIKDADNPVLCSIEEINENNQYSLKDFDNILNSYKKKINKSKKAKKSFDKEYSSYKTSKGFNEAVIETLIKYGHNMFSNYKDFINLCFAFKSEGYSYDDVDAIFKNSDRYDYDKNKKLYDDLSSDDRKPKITFGKAYYYAKMANEQYLMSKIQEQRNNVRNKIIEEIFLKYLYNKRTKEIYNTEINENYTRADFKTFIESKLKERIKDFKVAHLLKNAIYTEFLQNTDSFIYGDYRIEYGLEHLKNLKGNIVEINNKKYYCDTEKHEYFEMPEFVRNDAPEFDSDKYDAGLVQNNSVWYPFLSLFKYPKIAYYTFLMWMKNVRLSYLGKSRPNPLFPIIFGKQNIGKDYYLYRFLTYFIPDVYKREGTADIITDDRKFFNLENALIMRFSEMEKFDKADTNAVKSFITRDMLSYRVLGTHNKVDFKNITNCIGTTNKNFEDIFKDSTGERRFVHLELATDVTLETVKKIITECYKGDSTKLYETVGIDEDYKEELRILREYQENEMRYKTYEERFVSNYFSFQFMKTSSPDIKTLTFKTRVLFDDFKNFLGDIGFAYTTNIILFSKKIRSILENYGFTYDKGRSCYSIVGRGLEINNNFRTADGYLDKSITVEEFKKLIGN